MDPDEISASDWRSCADILEEVASTLARAGCAAQAAVAARLAELALRRDVSGFVNAMNSVDMWGGSGAVWEVFIAEQRARQVFAKAMMRLLEVMDRTKMAPIEKRAPVRELFAADC